MAKVITDTISWTLPCTQEVRYFTERKQSMQWMKLHCKRCKDCKDSSVTFAQYDTYYTVNSASDQLQLQQKKQHHTQQIHNIISS